MYIVDSAIRYPTLPINLSTYQYKYLPTHLSNYLPKKGITQKKRNIGTRKLFGPDFKGFCYILDHNSLVFEHGFRTEFRCGAIGRLGLAPWGLKKKNKNTWIGRKH